MPTMMKTTFAIAALMAALVASAASAQTTTISTQGSGFPIRDFMPRTSVISITDPAVLSNVTFSLNGLTHTFFSELNATLTHGGVTVNWLNNSAGGNGLNGNYLISDAGAMTLGEATGTPRASGTYRAVDSLSAFNGMSGAGDWTLTIADTIAGDSGNLNSWTLNLTSASAVSAVPEPASWAMMIGGFGVAGGTLRRRKKVTTKVAFAA